jgi:bifunctional DNA-binding transcriptional regulator/antitoxin component of YhaV-PrlF toxin-antitoxin module
MSEKVTIGKRGVVTLPAKLRKKYGMKERIQEFAQDEGKLGQALKELDRIESMKP